MSDHRGYATVRVTLDLEVEVGPFDNDWSLGAMHTDAVRSASETVSRLASVAHEKGIRISPSKIEKTLTIRVGVSK